MAKTQVLVEFGMGSSLRRGDYTSAAARAIRDALWHNSINAAALFGFERADMIIDVDVAVMRPDQVQVSELEQIFPYGQVAIHLQKGGLDIAKPDAATGGRTGDNTGGNAGAVMANVAVRVSFDMERVNG